jgi:Co/Zn/Cd efflux system component
MDRTAAFVIGLVTFATALVVTKGTINVLAETHPDNRWTTALQELVT